MQSPGGPGGFACCLLERRQNCLKGREGERSGVPPGKAFNDASYN